MATVAGFGCKLTLKLEKQNFLLIGRETCIMRVKKSVHKRWRISECMKACSFNYCVTWNPEIGRKDRDHTFSPPRAVPDRLAPRKAEVDARNLKREEINLRTSGSRGRWEMRGRPAPEWTFNWHHKKSLLWPLSCHANWRFGINRNLFSPRWIDMQNGSIFSLAH